MPAQCWPAVRFKVGRVTRVDACGTPPAALTANSQVTSSGLITVTLTPEYKDGEELEQVNGNGDLCGLDRSDDIFKRIGIAIAFCNVDPDMLGLTTNAPAEVDVSGVNVGFRMRRGVPASDFAFEGWAGTTGLGCAANEVQSLTEGGAGLTSFTLTYAGQTTALITASSTAANVQSKLEALSNIGPGNVVVTGPAGASNGPWLVTFTGALAGTNVAQMTATPTGGTGTLTVATYSGGGGTSTTKLGYFLLPHVHNGTIRDIELGNQFANFTVQGWTVDDVGWGKGPYNVVNSGAAGVASELDDAMLSGLTADHLLARLTTVAAPAAVCGMQSMPAAPTASI